MSHSSSVHVPPLINLHTLESSISISLFDFYIRCRMSDSVIMVKQALGSLQDSQTQVTVFSALSSCGSQPDFSVADIRT